MAGRHGRKSAGSAPTSSEPATGADFVARTRLTNKAGDVLARPGQTCEAVNPSSLGWLEAQGYIERRVAAAEPVAEGEE
ncbi:MAG: hypothetical protein AB7O67_16555 [Vicinamibacterales bacterium]